MSVAAFVGSPSINTLPAEIGADGLVRVAGAPVGLAAREAGSVTFAVRPENIGVGEKGLPARVEHIEFLGEAVLLHARQLGTAAAVIVRLDPADRPRLKLGAAASRIRSGAISSCARRDFR